MQPGRLRGLLMSGIIAGTGSVLVFLPQILILFLFILALEDQAICHARVHARSPDGKVACRGARSFRSCRASRAQSGHHGDAHHPSARDRWRRS